MSLTENIIQYAIIYTSGGSTPAPAPAPVLTPPTSP